MQPSEIPHPPGKEGSALDRLFSATHEAAASGSLPIELERDLVIERPVEAAGANRLGPAAWLAVATKTGISIVIGLAAVVQAGAASTAIQHSELAVEALHDNLGRVALLTGLVLPFARLELAFDIDLGAFAQILLCDPAQVLVEDHDRVPLRSLATLARGLVPPALACGDPEIGDRPPVLCAANLGISAEIADQNHLVHGTSHNELLNLRRR